MSEYLKTKLNDVTKYMHGVSMKIMSADYITLQNVIAKVSKSVCKNKDDYNKQLATK